ncbi:electron transfer flavoprotein subunit alpha/FixB family protein [Fodinibacter luteus]|uniref:Electron transfer flavoprotein subunit alpha/FixB family protein n=1 Tax=Fodinibacter luteus TaxID=552064 RepID=A0ABP8JYM5_9MICO
MSEILVLAELTPTGVRKATLELLTLARRLGEPAALVCGEATDEVVAALGEFGATKVYAVPAPEVAQFLSLPKAEAVLAVTARSEPAAVLVTSGPEGKDVAARVAVRLDSGLVTDAVDVVVDGGVVTTTQSVVAGAFHVRSQVVRGTPVITVMPNAVTAEAAPVQPRVEAVEVEFSERAKGAAVTSRTPKASSARPDLADASVIVAGGRGIGSEAGLGVIEALADALGGAVGVTRAVSDLHWAPHDLQIGQTGKTVAPALYVAAGVSGAIQHRAGMQSSKTIVAVNKDPKAPIFAIADFGVVGDLHTVLPALVDEVGKRRG